MNSEITFSGRFNYKAKGGMAPHTHQDDYQIQMVLSGSSITGIDDQRFKTIKGDIIFLKKGSKHYYTVTSPEGMKTLEVKFKTEDPETIALLDTILPIFRDNKDTIKEIFSNIILEGQKKMLNYKLMSNSLLQESLVIMSRICGNASVSKSRRKSIQNDEEKDCSAALLSVKDYIYRNISRSFSLREMAMEIGYNQDYLYRLIRKEMGVSAIQYVNNIKYEYVIDLMQNSGLSISEISWNVGFESPQYFSRFFKAHSGMSPTEYLASVRETIRTDY